METGLNTRKDYVSWFLQFSRVMSILVIIMASLVLIGWQFDIQLFKSVFNGVGNMNPTTAVFLILLMLSLKVVLWDKASINIRIAAQVLTTVIIILSTVVILRHIAGVDLGIDQLIFRDKVLPGSEFGDNRQAFTTALNFILLGIAILLAFRKQMNTAQLLAFITTSIALMSIIGYLYNIEDVRGYFGYTQMPFNVALCFFFGSLAASFSGIAHGNTYILAKNNLSGKLLRIFVPLIYIATIVIGFIILYLSKLGAYDVGFGLALNALVIIVFFLTMIFVVAMNLDKTVEKNIEMKSDLSKRNEELEKVTEDMQNKVDELERLNKLMVGRELKMMELKSKLKNLEAKNEQKN
jgi:cell division protein FtsB